MIRKTGITTEERSRSENLRNVEGQKAGSSRLALGTEIEIPIARLLHQFSPGSHHGIVPFQDFVDGKP